MKMLPILLTNISAPCLIVGGGKVGCRKAEKVLQADFELEIESPVLENRFAELNPNVIHLNRNYISRDLSAYSLVFACTDNPQVNRQVYTDAQKAGVPVSLADNPALSTFHLPAIIRRDPLVISISSGTPGLSRKLANDIIADLPEDIASFAAKIQHIREELKANNSSPDSIRKFIKLLLKPENYRKVLKYDCKELLKQLEF